MQCRGLVVESLAQLIKQTIPVCQKAARLEFEYVYNRKDALMTCKSPYRHVVVLMLALPGEALCPKAAFKLILENLWQIPAIANISKTHFTLEASEVSAKLR